MFSVVVPLYNKQYSIRNTIQSILDQSFRGFELIVVDDGSKDESANVVNTFTDDRIQLVRQENQGVSAARNTGIKLARYQWVALLDGDDLWRPNHLIEIVKAMNAFPNEYVYATSVQSSGGQKISGVLSNREVIKISNYFSEVRNSHICHSSCIVMHKTTFESIGYFNTSLNWGEDREMWGRLSQRFNVIKNCVVTVTYRKEAEARSNRSFILDKSLDYNYDFTRASSVEEVVYHKNAIIKRLLRLLRKGRLVDFFRLKMNHSRFIPWRDVMLTGLNRKLGK